MEGASEEVAEKGGMGCEEEVRRTGDGRDLS